MKKKKTIGEEEVGMRKFFDFDPHKNPLEMKRALLEEIANSTDEKWLYYTADQAMSAHHAQGRRQPEIQQRYGDVFLQINKAACERIVDIQTDPFQLLRSKFITDYSRGHEHLFEVLLQSTAPQAIDGLIYLGQLMTAPRTPGSFLSEVDHEVTRRIFQRLAELRKISGFQREMSDTHQGIVEVVPEAAEKK